MRAMILAAGRGERLRPITDTIPKPMVKVGGKELLLWHILKLKKAGITQIIVNSAHLSEKIVSFLKDGADFGVSITHSVEGPTGLETAGGIIKALPFFKGESFLVVNGDTFIDADYSQFIHPLKKGESARIYLVENPEHNSHGDFSLDPQSKLCSRGPQFTFSGVAVYSSAVFEGYPIEKRPLLPIFEKLAQNRELKGELLKGSWFDVGTIERLNNVNTYIKSHNII
ncbi:MAG: nucleotidyltransferase family protein [Succinivibrio dextrinosolvens]|nr:nucleotidyltransferase family protein [Succinivibrio dextrinosolvens]MDY6420447.1 nucleotidyltransferase family protein [Succinivibrio dextrinosolvens]MDY6470506.1 nucleotidyltransferase family protein [Succinivibrio dextrinosolvens]